MLDYYPDAGRKRGCFNSTTAKCLVDQKASPSRNQTKRKRPGVSAFITSAQKAELREQGYSDDDIALMIPAVAHRILGLKMNPVTLFGF
jgi:hypothetical protein